MSEFEFLRNVTIGQYYPVDSPLKRLDPRTRLISYLLILMAVVFASDLKGMSIGLVVVLAGICLARIPLLYALRGLLPPLPFLIFLAALQVVFNPYPDTQTIFELGGLVISAVDFFAGLILLVRFSILVLGIGLATSSLSTLELTGSLETLLAPLTRMGLPTQDFVMTLQIALRFLPFLAQAAERVAKAQAARGADWGNNRPGGLVKRVQRILPLFVPLFLIGLRRGENMALAMDARGYGSNPQRTLSLESRFGWLDAAVVLVAAVMSLLIVLI